jgi:hypothetical protein
MTNERISIGSRVYYDDNPGTVIASYADMRTVRVSWDNGHESVVWESDLMTEVEHDEL